MIVGVDGQTFSDGSRTEPSSVLGIEACGVKFNRETIPQVDGEEMFHLDIGWML